MATSSDLENLVLAISADNRQMLRTLRRMERDTNSTTRRVERQFNEMGRRIDGRLALVGQGMFRGVEGQMQRFAAQLGPVGMGLTALGPAGLAASAGIGALILGLGKGNSSAAESERIFRRLDAVLKLAGNAAGMTAGEIDGFARNLERATGIAANEINAAAAALATYTNISGERFKGVIRLSTDMVAVYGGNLREWSDKIARAIDDPIQGFAALRRAGFQLTDAQLALVEDMRKVGDVAGYQNEMIRILSDSLGGAAGAQNKGMAGAATRAKNAVGAFFEEMSRWTGVGPAVNKVLTSIANGLEHVANVAEQRRRIELDVGVNVPILNAELIAIEDRIASIGRGEEGIVPDSTMTALHAERDRLAAEIEGMIERGHREVNDLIAVEAGERIAQWGASTDLINDNAKAAEDAARSYATTQERLTALGTAYDDTKGKIEQARDLWRQSAADLRTMTDEEKAAYEERGAAIDAWAAAEEDAYTRQQASLQRQLDAEAKRGQSKSKTRDEVKALISELEHELSLIGQTASAQRIANEMRRIGAKATKDQREEVERLILQIERETEAVRQLEEQQRARTQALGNLFSMAEDGLTSIVDGSVKAEDAIKKLAIQLALAAAQAALLGTGPFAGLFQRAPVLNAGGGFAGLIGYSKGTANTGGQRGEPRGIVHGQEAVIPLPGGGKVPVEIRAPEMPKIAGAMINDAPTNLNFAPTYNFAGTAEELSIFRREMARRDNELSARIVQAVRTAQKRGML